MPRPLDGACKRTLMLRAIAGDAPPDDLPLFSQEFREPVDFLEINEGHLFRAKAANFFPEETAAASPGTPFLISIPVPIPAPAPRALLWAPCSHGN